MRVVYLKGLYITKHAVFQKYKMVSNMSTDNFYRSSLIEELCSYSSRGIKLYIDGESVDSENHLADLILGESNCTYMRNYHFEDGKVTEIDFDKIKI